MKYTKLLYLFVSIVLVSCSNNDDTPKTPETSITKISVEGKKFVDAEGKTFFPWGFNYTNQANGVGLLEDNWANDNVWKTIQEDFLEMKAIGANIIRIHLQYHQFMLDANTPNPDALNRLKALVDFAEVNNIYLDVTGLAAYRKSDQPSFYNNLTDEERWNTQALFWQNVAEKIGGSPAVFAYNLMNEPVVSVGCDGTDNCEWLPGDGFGGYHFVQNITRTPRNEAAPTMKAWMATLTQAIRAKDSKTPITIGFLFIGNFNQFATDLDYLSTHLYPKSGEVDKTINQVLNNQGNVPIVIEETYNLACNVSELQQFLDGIDGKYQGLMGHYFGTPLNQLDDTNINEAIQKNFLEFFIKNNPN
ncbi:cellulase family glycosylhydrolase [Aureibaculum sp. 2210JD6-5]|uniref:cellulase family glycosylhydrolase n=1 Tax=Aureibaculum sp. 2210JD6-5 TaxID=3103957 RepID=UPI002AADE044|nr:cellulase family glycosylhydrolase [Aureibaculum sp. 2210JD6-5]MDY7396961.1 cellulase family glycosylhydrolase [Aureibaculum sp. 2210JD6-5]